MYATGDVHKCIYQLVYQVAMRLNHSHKLNTHGTDTAKKTYTFIVTSCSGSSCSGTAVACRRQLFLFAQRLSNHLTDLKED